MGNRLTEPDIQFFDNAGLPLAGGTLAFYLSTTTTPSPSYSDRALTTPNTNPIVLDSAGRAGNVFLDPAITYKCVLSTAAGIVLWTRDPVVDPSAGVTAAFQVYAGNPNGHVAGTAGAAGGASSSVIWDATNTVLYICTTTGLAASAVWTAASNAFTGAESIKTNDYTVLASDAGLITTANKVSAITFSLTAAATVGSGKLFGFKNIGGGTLTLDPNGAELIDGAATLDLTINQAVILYCTGSGWRAIAQYTAGAGVIAGTSATLASTDPSATAGPTLTLDRASASPAVNDIIGEALYSGRNDTGLVVTYNDIIAKILDPTTASEDGTLVLRAAIAGALTAIMTVGPGVQIGAPTGGDKGAGTLNVASGLFDGGFRTGMALLTSGTVAAAATLDLVLTSYTGFRGLILELSGFVPATDGADLWMRFSTDGGATYDAAGYDYAVAVQADNAGINNSRSGSDTKIIIAPSVGFSANEGVNVSIKILNQTATAFWSRAHWSGYLIDNTATPVGNAIFGGGAREAAQDTDAVRFLFSAGNITAGNYAIYGLR